MKCQNLTVSIWLVYMLVLLSINFHKILEFGPTLYIWFEPGDVGFIQARTIMILHEGCLFHFIPSLFINQQNNTYGSLAKKILTEKYCVLQKIYISAFKTVSVFGSG